MNTRREHIPTSELIAAAGDRLTPTDRVIAEAVLSEPTLLAFGTVTDLADAAGTSRPSIVRFATKLGFDGYSALREYIREDLSHRLSRPSERIRHEDPTHSTARVALEKALSTVFDATDGKQLAELASPIVAAHGVWITSGETSRAGAFALHSGLSIVRPNVHMLHHHNLATDLSGASDRDAAVIFDFPRYRSQTMKTACVLADIGVHIVAITDGPLSPLASLTRTWCSIDIPAVGPLDSSVPAVAIAELIVAAAAAQLHDTARTRIDRIESLWDETGTFVR
ncbi:MAG: SIS domain-containing protein [Proteobacteria bacterium]|nr:SIS domain-containing protein [Pseudomonadota bacterium]